jgi:hypothetical protein
MHYFLPPHGAKPFHGWAKKKDTHRKKLLRPPQIRSEDGFAVWGGHVRAPKSTIAGSLEFYK